MIKTKTDKQEIKKLKLTSLREKNSDKTLLQENDFFASFLQDFDIWVWNMDLDGNFTNSSSTVSTILGYSIEEIIKRNVTELCVRKQDSTCNSLKTLKKAIKKRNGWKKLSNRFQHKNGSIVYTVSTAHPIFDDEDNVIGYRGIDHDITEQISAEEKFKDTEDKFRMIAENTNDLITICNLNHKADYTYVSPSIKQIGGFAPEELLGKSAFDFMHPEDKKNIFPFLKNTIRNSFTNLLPSQIKPVDEKIEYRARHKSGGWRHMQCSGKLFDGKILFISRDITEQKAMVEKLKKSEEQLRLIAENSKDIISLQECTPEMNYVYLNSGFKEITGYEPEDYIGISPLQLIDPQDSRKLLNILKKYFDPQKSKNIPLKKRHSVIKVEYKMKIKSGCWRHFQSLNRIVGDNILSVSRDITVQKTAEEKLIASELRLRKAKEMVNVEFFEYDYKINKLYITESMKSNYDLTDESDQNSLFNLIIPEDVNRVKETVLQARAGIPPHPMDFRVIGPNQRVNWLHVNFELSLDDQNEPQSLFVAMLDITETKKTQEEIKQARERLGVANSILRHDITNDLMVINSALNIYRRQDNPTMLNEIRKRVRKSLSLIKIHRDQENFIESSRELHKINLLLLLNPIIQLYSQINIEITGNETVYADKEIHSVFENLISNAIKHGKATKIVINIATRNNLCEIRVADNGSGVDDKIKTKIFNKGFIHGESGHTGIGLHVVKQTIKSYNGKITVEDNVPVGTVFVITLRKAI